MLKFILNNKHFHIIRWFPEWCGFSIIRLNIKRTSYALIYEWFLHIGFIEIRKWKPRDKYGYFIQKRNNSK